jgi:hypothetical protein
MDDAVEIVGFSAVLRTDPRTGKPKVWLPEYPAPAELHLILRYRGQEYEADLAHTVEGRHRLGVYGTDEATDQGDSWTVRVQHHRPEWGGVVTQFIDPLPTLEAAIVAALSAPYVMWEKQRDHSRQKRRQ